MPTLSALSSTSHQAACVRCWSRRQLAAKNRFSRVSIFVAKCNKVEATGDTIFAHSEAAKIASAVASIL
jgi:hypothetical protein